MDPKYIYELADRLKFAISKVAIGFSMSAQIF